MIRITDDFAVRRIGSIAVASIVEDGFPVIVTLTAAQAKAAVEAFNVIAVMLEAGSEQELEEVA